MPKVIFEYDENEDREDIELIVNRYKMWNALNDLKNLKRNIYKGYYDEDESCLIEEKELPSRYNPDRKTQKAFRVISDEEIKNANAAGEYVSGKTYLKADWVENKLDQILERIYTILE